MFGYAEQGSRAGSIRCRSCVLSGRFRRQGDSTEIDGQSVLRRIVYSPEAVTRVYVGPDFVIRERLFVPLDARRDRYLRNGRYLPSISWSLRPGTGSDVAAGIGGQEVNGIRASAYLLSEPSHRFTRAWVRLTSWPTTAR